MRLSTAQSAGTSGRRARLKRTTGRGRSGAFSGILRRAGASESTSEMSKQTRFNIGYSIVALLAFAFIQYLVISANQVAPLAYSEFQNLLRQGKVASVAASDRFVKGTLKEPLSSGQRYFFTTRIDPDLAGELDKYGVQYTGQIESTLLRDLLSWIVPVLLFVGIWWYIGKRMSEQGLGGGLMSIGKSKAKIYVESDTGVTF